jgi:two-component system, OmpR family, alkaline phosphatase synthesis response regulator PhoP
MNSGALYQKKENPAPPQKKCAWIIGGAFDPWWAIALDLHQYGIEAKLLGFNSDLREIVTQAELEGGVVVVDLMKDIERGLGIMNACHGYSASVPLIPVVADPSLNLAQRLRDLRAFCLAVHPLDTARVRSVLEEAFRYVQRMRLAVGTRKKKILVIDDDKDYCRSVQALLEREGYEVSCAMSGSQGLEMAISVKPDLIVLDVMMENMWAGYEVSQTLKFRSGYESVGRVPIVMVSSIEEHPAERFARSSDPAMVGPDVYLTKPIDVKVFVDTVRTLLQSDPAEQVQR